MSTAVIDLARLTPEQLVIARTAIRHDAVWSYVIQAGGRGGLLKIGRTGDVDRRLRELQNANGEALAVIGAWRDVPERERELHAAAASIRVHGEWFLPEPGLLRYARRLNEWRPS